MSTPRSVMMTRSWLFPPWSLQSTPPGRMEQGSSSSPSAAAVAAPSPLSSSAAVLELRRLGEEGLLCPRSPQLTLPLPVGIWGLARVGHFVGGIVL